MFFAVARRIKSELHAATIALDEAAVVYSQFRSGHSQRC